MTQKFDRIICTLEEILPYLGNTTKKKVPIKGHLVNIGSLRLATFKRKGLKCAKCGIEGSYFALESPNGLNPHLNLYAVVSEHRHVLMTRDHIYPKSKGGSDGLDNSQTMCERCNVAKGNDIPDGLAKPKSSPTGGRGKKSWKEIFRIILAGKKVYYCEKLNRHIFSLSLEKARLHIPGHTVVKAGFLRSLRYFIACKLGR